MKKRVVYIAALVGSFVWIFINTFYLPFFPWSTGIVRTWFLLNGYLPYRDLTWLRTPLDLVFLGGWFKFFGVSDFSYQTFILAILVLTALGVMIVGVKWLPRRKLFPLVFYTFIFPPLFQSAEMGELLIALYAIYLLIVVFWYLDLHNTKLLFLAGFIAGLSLITKQNSIGVIFAVILTVVCDQFIRNQPFRSYVRVLFYIGMGFLIPIGLLALFYFYNSGLYDLIYYTVIVVLGDYRRESLPQGISRGEGMFIEYGYFLLLLPLLLFWKSIPLRFQNVLFMVSLVVFLFLSLLPSYLSYRAVTAFPVIAVVAGYNLLLLSGGRFSQSFLNFKKIIILLCFFLFFILIQRFLNDYLNIIRYEGFHTDNIIKDYGENEYKVAEWIRLHTGRDERIISITHPIVYYLSNRFPKNKYVDPNPNMLYPFEKTGKIFINDPPRIVVFEETLLEGHPNYVGWPFYQYFRENYLLRVRYGSLTIYELPID